jgi:hypothetical protein
MRDLESPRAIYAKAALLLVVGVAAAVLVVLENPTPKTGLLLAIAVWSFCRLYYFAFYVIEHYVDDSYRFSGLWSFARYVWGRRSGDHSASARAEEPRAGQPRAGAGAGNKGDKV